MKVLLTGSRGFIGRNLQEGLQGMVDLRTPTHAELDLMDSETVAKYLEREQFDVVLHCATWNATVVSDKDRRWVLDHNLKMFFNLARHNDLYGHMFYFGSGAEYSRPHWHALMRENEIGKHIPLDDYGLSKYLMHLHAISSHNITNLRLFAVYGPHEDYRIRFISNAICRALFNLPIVIRRDRRFDYLWVGDLVEIVKKLLPHPPQLRSINVCTSQPYLLSDLAKLVLENIENKVNIEIQHDGLDKEYSGDNSALIKMIPTLSFTSPREGIVKLVNWYRQHQSEINPTEL